MIILILCGLKPLISQYLWLHTFRKTHLWYHPWALKIVWLVSMSLPYVEKSQLMTPRQSIVNFCLNMASQISWKVTLKMPHIDKFPLAREIFTTNLKHSERLLFISCDSQHCHRSSSRKRFRISSGAALLSFLNTLSAIFSSVLTIALSKNTVISFWVHRTLCYQ